jgi:predicted MPP superfamily phosphohydrolase
MLLGVSSVADTAVLAIALVLHAFLWRHVFATNWREGRLSQRTLMVSMGFLWVALLTQLGSMWRPHYFATPSHSLAWPEWWQWIHGLTLAWGFALAGASIIAGVLHRWTQPVTVATEVADPARRQFLGNVARAAPAAPLAIAFGGAAFGRFQFRLNHVKMPIAGLPPALAGFRIVQISDPHLGAFLDRSDLRRMVAMANEARPHLAVVTGDLITGPGDPLDAALLEVSRLRAEHGILGCHGNHEIYAQAVEYATEAGDRLGIRFLRGEAESIAVDSARLTIAGVDYQRMGTNYLWGAEKLTSAGSVNLLLSHNPDVYPTAARKGFAGILAGHTHGGQVNFEILGENLNIARVVTPYTQGLYRDQGASLYVNRGIGTVGIPVRLGSAPEVALIELCAT